jgi:hypothetical protein
LTPTLSPTPTTSPISFNCAWSAITEVWTSNANDWDECQPVPPFSPTPTQTPSQTPTLTPTKTPTPTPTPANFFILYETGDVMEAENGDLIEYEH